MFEIVFLGTSASAPSVERGLSASMIAYQDQRFLIDCGEGTQRQLLRSGYGFRKLDKILLTHGHLDHILGLGGLVSTFSRWESIGRLSIYGGQRALDRVSDLLNVVLRGGEADMAIDLIPVNPGVIWEDDTMSISAFPVTHRGPGCYGYAFEQKARRPFLASKAEELGVPRGPERKDLVMGKSITLGDGRVIEPEQVLGEQVSGVKLVHVGDAGRIDDLYEACQDADALVIESTYINLEADMARRFGHLTAEQAATLARDAGVKNLFLVHISRRYSERQIGREARDIFADAIVPWDLDCYRVLRHHVEKIQANDGC